jgi:hypothetical protein
MSSSCLKPCRLIALSEPFQGCCQYSTFLATLSQSESIHCNPNGEHDSRVVIDRSQVTSLMSILHLVHCVRLLHLTPCWLSRSTLFGVLALVVLVTPKIYLCKLIVIVHGLLGRLLLSVTIPCRESKPIARLVNFHLASESMQLKLCS